MSKGVVVDERNTLDQIGEEGKGGRKTKENDGEESKDVEGESLFTTIFRY